MSLALLAPALIAKVRSESPTTKEADLLGAPLIRQLHADGHIPTEWAHIEWAGVHEHGVVPVFFCSSEEALFDMAKEPGCLNVNADGSVTVFRNAD